MSDRIPGQGGAPEQATPTGVACVACSQPAPSEPPPVSWSVAIQPGRREWTCDRCSRENIRSIEGKLDPAWW